MILNLNKRGFKVDFSWLVDLEKVIKKELSLKKQISLALVDKKEIKKFNKVYRKKDNITDVLSFTLDDKYILGEIIICLEQARKQAKEKKKTLKSELQLLVVHGILHLLGYNHEKGVKYAKEQEKKEKEILNLIQWNV